MGRKILENVKMDYTWTTYIAAVGGVLRAAGWWTEETYKLMGMTGIGFHFIMHRQACASSVTVYDWLNKHLQALDGIGIHSEMFCADSFDKLNTGAKLQETAARRIKDSIDRGKGVVVWAPSKILEFGIITGYDDADQVFFVADCTGREVDPLLYANLGRSEVPMLSYQIIYDRIEVDREQIYRKSLEYAIGQWRKEFHISPDYASGSRAYDNLIATLEREDFDLFGLGFTVAVYADAKKSITQYLDFLFRESDIGKGLQRAVEFYGKAAVCFEQMSQLAPFSGVN
ncbi:MAG TPA: hypothetical protein VEC37_02640, partial [Bacillota bacterium]|nr:hypothetical protein [Bacillota bacterium]